MKDIILGALGINGALWFCLGILDASIGCIIVSAVSTFGMVAFSLLTRWYENKTSSNRIKVIDSVELSDDDYTSIF